jgi:hypothetical protein
LAILEANIDRFLLPVLQLRTILEEPTLGEMEDAFDSISHDLDAAFGETLLRIKSLPGSRSRLGMSALMWISHAKRPLHISELIDALAVRRELTKLDAKYRPSLHMILECCQGLVIMDAKSHFMRPAHYTIQEYLTSHAGTIFPRAAAEMASTCLRYLMFEDFADGPWKDKDEIESRMSSYPFLWYAASTWGSIQMLLEMMRKFGQTWIFSWGPGRHAL